MPPASTKSNTRVVAITAFQALNDREKLNIVVNALADLHVMALEIEQPELFDDQKPDDSQRFMPDDQ